MIDLSGITIPSGQPYDKTKPTQNQENYARLLLDLYAARKQADAKIFTDNEIYNWGLSASDVSVLKQGLSMLTDILVGSEEGELLTRGMTDKHGRALPVLAVAAKVALPMLASFAGAIVPVAKQVVAMSVFSAVQVWQQRRIMGNGGESAQKIVDILRQALIVEDENGDELSVLAKGLLERLDNDSLFPLLHLAFKSLKIVLTNMYGEVSSVSEDC